jgi:outer membrane lipoprotein LolB
MPNKSRPTAWIGRAIPLIALGLVTACAPRPIQELPVFTSWEDRNQVLAELPEWEFRGRLGVRSAEEGFNGKVHWRQFEADYNAQISGPIGFGTVRISGNPGLVRLVDRDGRLTVLTDPENDLRSLYGWTLPVSSLRFWALGIPDPQVPATTIVVDERGLLTVLAQGGWRIEYPDYRPYAGQPMPRRLVASAGDARVVLVFDAWVFK